MASEKDSETKKIVFPIRNHSKRRIFELAIDLSIKRQASVTLCISEILEAIKRLDQEAVN